MAVQNGAVAVHCQETYKEEMIKFKIKVRNFLIWFTNLVIIKTNP